MRSMLRRLSIPHGKKRPSTDSCGKGPRRDHDARYSDARANGRRRLAWSCCTTTGVILAVFSLMLLGGCEEAAGPKSQPPDPPPQPHPSTVTLSASPNPVGEGSSVTVTARLSAALADAVEIPVTVTSGLAEDGDHGTLASITIDAGVTSGTGTITTAQDADTDDETFTVALGNVPSTVSAGSPNSVTVTINDDDPPPVHQPEPSPPDEPEPACGPHPASQIVGDWDTSGDTAQDDEVYSFHADGTYEKTFTDTAPAQGLDQPPVTRTVTISGTYAYVARTCLLTWFPEVANVTHFVAWNGSDQFSTKFSPGGSAVITTFNRR